MLINTRVTRLEPICSLSRIDWNDRGLSRFVALYPTRRGVAAILLCFGLMLPALGQQPLQTLLVGIDHRTVTSLNGDWHYLVDQSPGRALYEGNGAINDRSYALNEHPNIVGNHNEEYDFATAPASKSQATGTHRCHNCSITRAYSGISETSTHNPNPVRAPSSISVPPTTVLMSGSIRNESVITRAASLRSIAKLPRSYMVDPTLLSLPWTPRGSWMAFRLSATIGSTTAASPGMSRL